MHKVDGGEEGDDTGYAQWRRVKSCMHKVGGGEDGDLQGMYIDVD